MTRKVLYINPIGASGAIGATESLGSDIGVRLR